MSTSCTHTAQLLSFVLGRHQRQHQPAAFLLNRSYQCCLRRLLAVKSKRRKVQMREKNSWKGLGHVPPPVPLRDRVSLFEKLDSLEFVLLMVPPMAACAILTIVTADIFQQQEEKRRLLGWRNRQE